MAAHHCHHHWARRREAWGYCVPAAAQLAPPSLPTCLPPPRSPQWAVVRFQSAQAAAAAKEALDRQVRAGGRAGGVGWARHLRGGAWIGVGLAAPRGSDLLQRCPLPHAPAHPRLFSPPPPPPSEAARADRHPAEGHVLQPRPRALQAGRRLRTGIHPSVLVRGHMCISFLRSTAPSALICVLPRIRF